MALLSKASVHKVVCGSFESTDCQFSHSLESFLCLCTLKVTEASCFLVFRLSVCVDISSEQDI